MTSVHENRVLSSFNSGLLNKSSIATCSPHDCWLWMLDSHPAGGRRWYVFKNAKWHLMFNVAACFPDPGWTWPSAPLVRLSYAFGRAQSCSVGLHLKGPPVLSDFSSLGKLRLWHCKNNNMLREGRGWRIKWVKRREWDNNNNKLSC